MEVETKADRFVGIDVSKARVDVYIRPDGDAFGGATNAEGLGARVERLKPLSPCLVVQEERQTEMNSINPHLVNRASGVPAD